MKHKKKIKIKIISSLEKEVQLGDPKTKKLFYKQKKFMEMDSFYPSLGRTRLTNVQDKYGSPLWEVRLDKSRRIVFVEREGNNVIWLSICSHDDLKRKNVIQVRDDYEEKKNCE